jgi:hypothetical protein
MCAYSVCEGVDDKENAAASGGLVGGKDDSRAPHVGAPVDDSGAASAVGATCARTVSSMGATGGTGEDSRSEGRAGGHLEVVVDSDYRALWDRLVAAPADRVYVEGWETGSRAVWRVGEVMCKEEKEWEDGPMVEGSILEMLGRSREHIVPWLWTETTMDPERRLRVTRTMLPHFPDGDVETYLTKHGIPSEETLWQWFEDIARALVTLHALNIFHADVRPHNMLVCNGGRNLVLSDFNIAHVLPAADAKVHLRVWHPDFVPPEQLCRPGIVEQPVGVEADVWMIGVAFAMIPTPRIRGRGFVRWHNTAGRDIPGVLAAVRPHVSAAFLEILTSCLLPGAERPTAQELVERIGRARTSLPIGRE